MGYRFDDTEVHVIAAHDERRGIGKNDQIPWKISDDLRRFKQLTTGHPVIVGRVTADTLPELKNRTVIVVSRQGRETWPKNAIGAPNLNQAFDLARKLDTGHVWVIGGEQIYNHAIYYADQLHLTKVAGDYACDRHFPTVDVTDWESFNEGGLNRWQRDEKTSALYMYTRYTRRAAPNVD